MTTQNQYRQKQSHEPTSLLEKPDVSIIQKRKWVYIIASAIADPSPKQIQYLLDTMLEYTRVGRQ